jgi:hypothetical protein
MDCSRERLLAVVYGHPNRNERDRLEHHLNPKRNNFASGLSLTWRENRTKNADP